MSLTRKFLEWWNAHVTLIAPPILIGAILLSYFRPTPPADWFCQVGEACVREWFSATAGWAAAIAAAAALYPLREQLKTQVKQTAFIVGDAPPTAYASDAKTDGLADIRVEVTNWNRRPLLITELSCDPLHHVYLENCWLTEEFTVMHTCDLADRAFRPPIVIGPWIDRAKPPNRAELLLRVLRKGEDKELKLARSRVQLALQGELLSESPIPVTIQVAGTVLTA